MRTTIEDRARAAAERVELQAGFQLKVKDEIFVEAIVAEFADLSGQDGEVVRAAIVELLMSMDRAYLSDVREAALELLDQDRWRDTRKKRVAAKRIASLLYPDPEEKARMGDGHARKHRIRQLDRSEERRVGKACR